MDQKILYAVGGAFAGAITGAGATYLILMKRFTTSFNEALDEAVETEVAATKKFYAAINKPAPEDLVLERGLKFEVQMTEGKTIIADLEYDTDQPANELTEVAKNVFTDYADNSTWDAEKEEASRDTNNPYVISIDEFFENEPDNIQTQLVYFGEDGVLADLQDKPVEDKLVGEENLRKFGHGSKDPNIVYIRNEDLDIDFEITYAEGKYSEQVQGFGIIQHEASPRRAVHKFRLDDD